MIKVKKYSGGVALLFIVVILALIALGVIGFLIWRQSNESQPTPSTPTPVVDLPSVSDPSKWNTYSNDKYGFSIKYPETWTEQGPVSDDDSTIVYLHAYETKRQDKPESQYYVWITVVDEPPDEKSAKKYSGKYTAYKKDGGLSQDGALSYFIDNNKKQFVVISLTPYDSGIPYAAQDAYEKILEQMITTFKLLDESGAGCKSDSECGEGYACDHGTICTGVSSVNCQVYGTGTCIKLCSSDNDCPEGLTCQQYSFPRGNDFSLKWSCFAISD
jgi:hypothetical protein